MKQKVIIVDENDDIIGHKGRDALDKEDIYRVSALWVTNSNGSILLARRHRNKSHHPGRWGPAVAGTVEEGENYKENIIKEAEEELGLKNMEFANGPKTRSQDEYNHFTQWFAAKIDRSPDEFQIQTDEVEEVKWFKKDELLKGLKEHPEAFIPNMKIYIKLFDKND